MTVVSVKQAKEDSPTLDEMERCRKLEIAIRELAATNETIFTLEAKINNIQLFPHLYGPEAKEEAINALERWKHERSRNQGEFNLCIPCPIIKCLHHEPL
ncbi:hypothetical protein NPIL_201911 [Nephila pilipes]|uniref:Uncharacterized protein n=1 Tax=Nephila pilipes TaxID=299642 RepID=A0A8X6P078_NEPPI|nr:hypothetical protein NPIL_201911 [Nephila pilipes]